jgi:hypothetical protein
VLFGSFDSFAAIVAACGGAGYVIDWWIGKAAQQRLKDRLETWWLTLSDVRWSNVGREEALFAVRVMDRLFGDRLFSFKRMIVVIAAAFVCGGFIIARLTPAELGSLEWRTFLHIAYLAWFIIILVTLAASFSITRFGAAAVARLLTKVPSLNLAALIFLLLLQYIMLVYSYWNFNSTLYTIVNLLEIPHVADAPILDIFQEVAKLFVEAIWAPFELAFEGISPSIYAIVTVPFTGESGAFGPAKVLLDLSDLLSLLPSLSRFGLAAIFIGSFLLQTLQSPFMHFWARVIESEKPVLTLLFAGGAAIAQGILAIVKTWS